MLHVHHEPKGMYHEHNRTGRSEKLPDLASFVGGRADSAAAGTGRALTGGASSPLLGQFSGCSRFFRVRARLARISLGQKNPEAGPAGAAQASRSKTQSSVVLHHNAVG